jgi:hypothetical protein
MAAKRRDYFVAGTQVIRDADVLKSEVVSVYRATDPSNPTVYRRGQRAEAEPAVPGWTMLVDVRVRRRTRTPISGVVN